MIPILQILVSVIFFTNKVLVLAEKKVGWLLGAIAAIIAVFYFYLIGFYVYTVLEFGLIVLMGYGFLKRGKKNPKVETLIRLLIIVVMVALAFFAFSGLITIIELISSLGLLIGTYMLTHHKNRIGWLLYALGHSLAAILGYSKEQRFFADFQIASAIVSFVGALKITPRTPS